VSGWREETRIRTGLEDNGVRTQSTWRDPCQDICLQEYNSKREKIGAESRSSVPEHSDSQGQAGSSWKCAS